MFLEPFNPFEVVKGQSLLRQVSPASKGCYNGLSFILSVISKPSLMSPHLTWF